MTPETGYVDAEGAALYFEAAGVGSAVVLLHPGLWDLRVWDEQVEPLAERHRVIRYDMRGFGRSDPVTGPFSNVDDLVAVLDALGVDRAALVGCSRGGRVAIDFTVEHPDRVRALVPVAPGLSGYQERADATPSRDWEGIERRLQTAIEAGDLEQAIDIDLEIWAPLGVADDVGRRIREIALENCHTAVLDDGLERRPAVPAAQRLSEISVPTLVILGDEDVAEINDIGRYIVEQVPGARLETLSPADHVVNMRQPDEFNEVLVRFLAEATPL